MGGKRYAVFVIDEFSRFVFYESIKLKSEAGAATQGISPEEREERRAVAKIQRARALRMLQVLGAAPDSHDAEAEK